MSAPQYGQQPYSPREGIAITTQYSVLAWRGRLRWTGGRPLLRHGDDRHGQVRRQCQRLRGHPDAVSAGRIRIAAAAFSLAGWVALIPVGIANADCTTPGDFGAGAGCPPPSSGSDNTESWPPTSVDWPPQLKSNSDSDNGGNGGGDTKATPIVMPSGQKPPPPTSSSGSDPASTSTPPKPIVPVGSASAATTPSTSTTATPIATAHG